jgi:hypothetical protein
MFVFAIETNGRTVAFTKEVDRVMLDLVLNGNRDEGQQLRTGMIYLSDKIGSRLWDGVSPFTARLATESEEMDYDITAAEHMDKEPDVRTDESILMFSLTNGNGENVLMIPPTLPQYDNEPAGSDGDSGKVARDGTVARNGTADRKP